MLALGIAVAVAMLIPLLTRGSYHRLVMTPWRWGALLFGGLALQLVLEFADVPESRWHDVGFGMLVASYVLIVGFCAGNLVLKGMAIVLIGVACNAIVITVNQGMPVEVPPDWENEAWVEPTIKHHPKTDDDRLLFLADIIVLREPFDTVISFGDLILAFGLWDVTFHASRRPRRHRPGTARRERRQRAPAPEPRTVEGRAGAEHDRQDDADRIPIDTSVSVAPAHRDAPAG
jgi:hypothetical protein